jgi:hypothetical protein
MDFILCHNCTSPILQHTNIYVDAISRIRKWDTKKTVASARGTLSRSNHEPTESNYRKWEMNGNVLNWVGGMQLQQGK